MWHPGVCRNCHGCGGVQRHRGARWSHRSRPVGCRVLELGHQVPCWTQAVTPVSGQLGTSCDCWSSSFGVILFLSSLFSAAIPTLSFAAVSLLPCLGVPPAPPLCEVPSTGRKPLATGCWLAFEHNTLAEGRTLVLQEGCSRVVCKCGTPSLYPPDSVHDVCQSQKLPRVTASIPWQGCKGHKYTEWLGHWRPLNLCCYCVFPSTLTAGFTRCHQIML